LSIEQDAESTTTLQPANPQGASPQGSASAEASELQVALWLAARAAIANGRRRRQERALAETGAAMRKSS
jgi:hypothetical protein